MDTYAIDTLKSKEKVLSISEVLQYFEENTDKLQPTFPPMKAKAGEIYLFVQNDTNKGTCKFQIIISAGKLYNYVCTSFKHTCSNLVY